MTNEVKNQIITLRAQGNGYRKIAAITGLSADTVKSFCRRSAITTGTEPGGKTHTACPSCGKPILNTLGQKPKKFCSDKCRNKWWNSHLYKVKRMANYDFTCLYCGKTFTAYGNKFRKYCSHKCYIEDRFGGELG